MRFLQARDQFVQETTELGKSVAARNATIGALTAEGQRRSAEHAGQLASKEEEAQALRNELAGRKDEAQALRNEVARLASSVSWRITRPLRALARHFPRLSQGLKRVVVLLWGLVSSRLIRQLITR